MDKRMVNPYAPPAEPVVSLAATAAIPAKPIATRTKRFCAAVIDAIAIFIVGTVLSRTYVALAGTTQTVFFAQLGILGASTMQWLLIAKRSQTLGKMLLKIRIVRSDGSEATPLHSIFLRSGPLFLLQCGVIFLPQLKLLFQFLVLFDDCGIFGARKRCIHDLIADTCVIDVS